MCCCCILEWCNVLLLLGFCIHVLIVRVASFSRSWLYKQEVVVSLCFTWSCIAAQSPIVRDFPLKFHKKEHPYKNASRVSLRMFTSAAVWHLTFVLCSATWRLADVADAQVLSSVRRHCLCLYWSSATTLHLGSSHDLPSFYICS